MLFFHRAMRKVGDRVGRLTLLQEKREKGRKFFYCKCDCGNEKWIRADHLGVVVSCGCYNKERNSFKVVSIAKKRYGKLVAIEPTGEKENGSIVWKCKCDCGNVVEIAQNVLEKGTTNSCGCLKSSIMKEKVKENTKAFMEENYIEGTNIKAIQSTTPLRNNSTGIRGVSYDSSRGKYVAQIEFKGKRYHLGRYNTKEEAKKVYEKAKEELHKKFLEELEASK